MTKKGESWNESETYSDPITLRKGRRLTRFGLYNQTPTYHTNAAFTADGEFLVFATGRDGGSAVMKAHVPTGELTQLTDWIDGIGSRSAMHQSAGGEVGDGRGVSGGGICIAPKSRWCVYSHGRSLGAVHLNTLEERVLIEDIGQEWISGVPSVSPDEKEALVTLRPSHPELRDGVRATKSYIDWLNSGREMKLRIVAVPLEGGEVKEVYKEDGITSAHSPHCPADRELLLFDRDRPPEYWVPANGKGTRIWILDRRTNELRPLLSRDPSPFQVHSAWTFDGRDVIYHGPADGGGWYIGVISREGEVKREFLFEDAQHYGHVSADPARPAIILDGNLSPDLLLWLYYDEENPRVEIIGRHGTEWRALPGQYPHPHPLADPTGRYISFNVAQRGRSDVCVISV